MNLRFENDVKMYGTQTENITTMTKEWFENDVKMYGTQTDVFETLTRSKFENDVKMYGTQTDCSRGTGICCLRMM